MFRARTTKAAGVRRPWMDTIVIAFLGAYMLETKRSPAYRRRQIRAALAIMLWIAAAASLCAQSPAGNSAGSCIKLHETSSATVHGFIFKAYRGDNGSCLQVFHAGRVIFRRMGDGFESFTLGQPAQPRYGIPAIANGADLTGRGRPDMIVSFFSGGAHCCTSHLVFELEPSFRLLATLNDADDDLAHFAPAPGGYVYLTADWTFAYWKASFADSPGIPVVLRFTRSSGFHLALDRMRTPDPTPAEWEKLKVQAAAAFHQTNPFSEGIGSALWGNMLNLIYTGHSELAWKLFDGAWPAKRTGKNEFLSAFCSQLKTSPYWPDLRPALGHIPAACAAAGPTHAE